MKSSQIINSIALALTTNFDKEAAINRLQGYINKAGPETLQVKKDRSTYSFHISNNGKTHNLSKSSDDLYRLARKRYCILLIKLLEAKGDKQEKYLRKISDLLIKYEIGNLDLPRIVFTSKQYKWYVGAYVQKPQTGAEHKLGDGFVRSKSEQDIGLELIGLAVPFHYEEQLKINVIPLVRKLEEMIRNGKFNNWEPKKNLFYYNKGVCYWNVPPELQWMNAPGSVWKTYDYKTGEITMYTDFKIMLAAGIIKLWEHEGLMDDPTYRCNASERISLMEFTQTVDHDDLITTFEFDTDDKERLRDIIVTRILPGLWW